MKKRYGAILGIVVVLAGLFTAQSANAAGVWQPYPGGFTTPSNWTCGLTLNGPKLSAQTCVVRSGDYTQSATIVRNRTSSLVTTQVAARLVNDGPYPITTANCLASGVGANSVSVCFSPTVLGGVSVASVATVSGIYGELFGGFA